MCRSNMLYAVLIYSRGYRTPVTTTPFLQSFFGGIWVHGLLYWLSFSTCSRKEPFVDSCLQLTQVFYQPDALVTLPESVHRTVLIIVLCILQMIIVAQMLYVRGKGWRKERNIITTRVWLCLWTGEHIYFVPSLVNDTVNTNSIANFIRVLLRTFR